MDQFSRLKLITGDDKFNLINNTTVLVLGVGGVGSYAVESLVRSGIGRIIIVDNDKVDITNLNRQLMTLHSNIGKYKVDVLESRIKDINPNCEVIKIKDFITTENINILFKYDTDYVIDACDTVDTKKSLIRECIKRKIKFISCMGTGNKLDPTKLEIIDIRKTSYDPLARIIRKMIKDEKIKDEVMVVASTEQPIKNDSNIIGSNSYVPATAGLLCASYVINDIIK